MPFLGGVLCGVALACLVGWLELNRTRQRHAAEEAEARAIVDEFMRRNPPTPVVQSSEPRWIGRGSDRTH